jgi:fructoselysine-6-P-deglycase FrlB-like protein
MDEIEHLQRQIAKLQEEVIAKRNAARKAQDEAGMRYVRIQTTGNGGSNQTKDTVNRAYMWRSVLSKSS